MKSIAAGLLFILSVAALAGCVRDNRDDCPDPMERNLVLHFEYTDEQDNDIFDDRVEMVDVIMFDEYYNFYNWIYVGRQSLDEFRGLRTDIEPGDYHIVCWANVSSSRNDLPDDETTLDQSAIYHYNPETADPLHYAPDRREATANRGSRTRVTEDGTFLLKVAASGTTEDTISFMSAHRTVNVYLSNFPGMDDPQPVFPVVTIEHLSDYYDFALGRGPENTYFVQTTNMVDVDGENYCHAKFYIQHFDYQNQVKVVVALQPPYDKYRNIEVPMSRILEINDIEEVYDGDDIVLYVEIIWGDSFVEVKLPKFRVVDTEPEF